MADCANCTHADDRHDETPEGGLAACNDCACPAYYEAVVLAEVTVLACGIDGLLVVDSGVHSAQAHPA